MAKGYNPADAHRKAEKKKAAKKNKEQRQSAKEASDVKRGTGCMLRGCPSQSMRAHYARLRMNSFGEGDTRAQ